MNDSMGGFFGIIGLACGMYVLYAWFQMRRTGEINTTILLPKSENPKKCKNKAAYIQAVSPKMLALGLAAVFYGAVDLCCSYMKIPVGLFWAAIVIFLAVLIWFAVSISRLNKTYF
ncbi:hypothetical protein ABXS75_16025 [Roseburia hominis]